MIDEELSAALKEHYKAWYETAYDPARRRGEPVPSMKQRFLAAVGGERGPELWARIATLEAEARLVPDPGGPIGNYGDVLAAWAATHPEIDPREMHWITRRLMTEHR